MNENGEYTNIVIKLEDDLPENSCGSLLNNLKVINVTLVTIVLLNRRMEL